MRKLIIYVLAMPFLFMACQDEGIPPQSEDILSVKSFQQKLIKVDVNFNAGTNALRKGNTKNNDDDPVLNFMTKINAEIGGQGILLEKVELLGSNEAGRTVFFKNTGNKQLSSDYVPNDPRNIGGTAIPYWIDNTELGTSSGMSEQATSDAIHNSMNTWAAVTCSQGLNIPFLGESGFDVGLVQFLVGQGGFEGYLPGTILHAGILPADFFEIIGGLGGGDGILGVTFTFIWTDDVTNEPTDIDRNGKTDVAIKEIYINDNDIFNWQDAPNDVLFDAEGVIDFETVVLHEVGHGLSQGHFGTAFRDGGQGNLHFSPAALMNAGYTVGRRDISRTDESGHCSNWGAWPNN